MTTRVVHSTGGRSGIAAALGLWSVLSLAQPPAAPALTANELGTVRAAALSARDHCQRLMHEDSIEFLRCVDLLLLDLPVDTRTHALKRLGTAYYAWLASTAALKNGLPTADETALHFFGVLRAVQLPLRVSDEALCPSIPGDCTARNARLRNLDEALTPDDP
jgi:hypothetical protein